MSPAPASLARPAGSARARRIVSVLLLSGLALAGCAGTTRDTAPAAPARIDPAAALADAEAAYAARDWARAEAGYLAAVRASPRDPQAWFKLGNVYFRRGEHELAARAYEEALRVAPDHAKAWHNLGVVRLHQADASFAHVLDAGEAGDAELAASAAAQRAIIGEAIAPGTRPAP